MYKVQGYLASRLDTLRRIGEQERGQATVEYVGLVVVTGLGIGLISGKLEEIGYGLKIGKAIMKGLTKGITSVFGG